jgi:hypothetical protein
MARQWAKQLNNRIVECKAMSPRKGDAVQGAQAEQEAEHHDILAMPVRTALYTTTIRARTNRPTYCVLRGTMCGIAERRRLPCLHVHCHLPSSLLLEILGARRAEPQVRQS